VRSDNIYLRPVVPCCGGHSSVRLGFVDDIENTETLAGCAVIEGFFDGAVYLLIVDPNMSTACIFEGDGSEKRVVRSV